ncbi:MAG: hypothetical protein ABIN91_15600 [Mucilaginibacter sp.]|uniref:hypothetical protein n=1 Tax=Mucilaginibacter sp. TaxID=1882438 RepID=UPI0032653C7C
MKKLLIIITVLIGLTAGVRAQSTSFQPFKLDVGAGFDFVSKNSVSFIITVEPHYRFADVFALGLRFQQMTNLSATKYNIGFDSYASQCLSGDYYVTDTKQKLMVFIGGGAGAFEEQINNSDTEIAHFGYFPRIGLETGRFRASLEYNVTGGTKNYFAINAGIFFWGKRK